MKVCGDLGEDFITESDTGPLERDISSAAVRVHALHHGPPPASALACRGGSGKMVMQTPEKRTDAPNLLPTAMRLHVFMHRNKQLASCRCLRACWGGNLYEVRLFDRQQCSPGWRGRSWT